MKTYKILFSFLIAFSTALFGQNRTSPVISTTSTSASDNSMQIYWEQVNIINGKSLFIKIKKSIDCATLKNITAFDENGGSISINLDKTQFNKLNTETEEEIKITFNKFISDLKVKLQLEWDLSACSGEITTNITARNKISVMVNYS